MAKAQQGELTWFKSSYSTGLAACMEFAKDGDVFSVRDSNAPDVRLHCTYHDVEAFILGAKKGDFDHLLDAGS